MNTPVCLLHGWGANRHIFKEFGFNLQQYGHCVTAWDLPGHGENQTPTSPFDIIAIADEFAGRMTTPHHFFAWSLGSLIALYIAARHPQKVLSLTICSGFAKLCAAPDYPEGLHHVSLSRMIGLFQQDYAKYMRQFLELQLINTANKSQILTAVLPDMIKHGHPQALQAALDALESADARSLLAHIQTPTLLLYGNKDTITPVRMGSYLHQHLPHSQLYIIDRAAHAPFLSHMDETIQIFIDFIQSVSK